MTDVGTAEKAPVKWYLKPVSIIIAILLAGPFALPLVWISPALRLWHKIAITILAILLTVWLITASAAIYESLVKELRELQAVM